MLKIVVRGELSQSERMEILAICPEAEVVAGKDEVIAKKLPDADIVWGRLTKEQFAQVRSLKLMQVVSAGVEHLLFPEFLSSPTRLCTTSGMHGAAIAEHVFSMLLAFARGLPQLQRQQQEKSWRPFRPVLLQNKNIGIVGFGAIGQAVGERALAFGMKVYGMRNHPSPSTAASEVWGGERLEELLPLLDHLVLAVPLTPQTENLINKERLKLLKPSAYIYNIARGAVVDEAALAAALSSGELAGAGLDVFSTEPLPEESPLWEMPNVIITPHTGGYLADYRQQAFAIFLDNLHRWQAKLPLRNEVDKRAGY